MVDFEEILRDREASGLRVPPLLRIGITVYLAFSVGLWGPEQMSVRIAIVPAVCVLVAANLAFLWLLNRRQHVRLVGYLGAALDALALGAAALSWYWFAARGELAPGFLTKAPLTVFTLALVAINSLALRPAYPLIVTAGGLTVHAAVAYAVATDPRTLWADRFAAIFAGPGVTPIMMVNQIVIVAFVGGGLAYLSRTAQRTIRQTIELEVDKARIRQEQTRLLMEQKLAALAKLVAGISHEVNSPLGALQGGADTQHRALTRLHAALQTGDVAEAARLVDALEKSAEVGQSAARRIDATMRSLRRFARLDEGTRQRIDLAECIDSALSMLPAELRARVPSRLPDTLPQVDCDPAQLNQAFFAVLSHACERGEQAVALAASNDGAWVAIEVAYRCQAVEGPELFEVTLAASPTRVAAQFDLPIANSILTHHGGSLELRAQGVDKRFIVRLPLLDVAAAVPSTKA